MERTLLLSMHLFAFYPWVLRLIFRHVAQVASVSALSGT
jgi:hypothetical protein